MAVARAGEISRRLARALDAEATAFDTVSVEFVPVILAGDVSEVRGRRGIAFQEVGAGGAGLRSEIALVVVNGRMDRNEVLWIPRVVIEAGAAIAVQMMIEIATSGFSTSEVAYGDAEYGNIGPALIQAKNTAVLSAGGRSLGGGVMSISADRPHVFPVNVTLRPADLFPNASNILLIRPNADNQEFRCWFEWQVIPDVR